MSIEVELRQSIDAVEEEEYQAFFRASGASFFYDRRFLCAAERSPLLPVNATYYFLARDEGRLVAFLPAYVQTVDSVDPFGLLARTAGIAGDRGQQALFSHVMHCFDSKVVCVPGTSAPRVVVAALKRLASDIGVHYVGLLNVAEADALRTAAGEQLMIRHLVDRYYLDLTRLGSFDELVRVLPKEGRHEMTRQLRKFDASDGTVTVIGPPFDHRLESLTSLCQQTTARNGTPKYFPADALARFVRICGDLARIVLVEEAGAVVGGLVCFLGRGVFCIWSAGMRYDLAAYSPYTVSFACAYRWALAHGIETIEAGRLNERIKVRLGLKPLPLYSATSEVVCATPSLPNEGCSPGASHGTASL